MRNGRGAAVGAALWAVVCAAGTALAQPGGAVTEIRFEGAERSTRAYLESVVQTRVGEPFDAAVVDQDVVRLLQTGKFSSVTSEVVPGEGGAAAVVFRVRERTLIASIQFENNRYFNEKTLLGHVQAKAGDPVDAFALREGRDNILEAYRGAGFGRAIVEVDTDQAHATGRVVYRIEEGEQVRVRKVLFEGNQQVATAELKKRVRTTSALWIFRPGVFDPDVADADAATLQSYCRDQGFLDARASYRVDAGKRPGDLAVVFMITEGTPYVVEAVRVTGNTVFGTEDILGSFATQAGLVFNQSRLEKDAEALRTRCGDYGYIYATVRALRVFSATPGFVVLTFEVNEGEPMRVGRVVVRGNEMTQDKVVRRALDLYPEDTFRITPMRNAERDLRQTQLFEEVSVTPVGQEAGVRDIVVDVKESTRLRDFIFGFGVTSDSGLVGSIVLDYKNFDIFDTPRSFSEFIKFRSFRGAGQRLRLELQPGTELNRFRIDFTEPYWRDQPVRFDVSLYHFNRGREGWDEQRTGGSVSFGRRLEKGIGPWGWLKGWYGEVAFGEEYVVLDDVDIFDDRSVRDVRGGSLLSSAKLTTVRDRTDNRWMPTEGDRLTLSYEQFLGDFNFGVAHARYAKYHTLFVDEQDRKSILSWRVDAGAIAGEAPVFEKLYAGGIGSLRGFEFRGIGPRGGLEKDPIGGDYALTSSVEYTFPLAAEVLRGVVFTDMGTVEEDFEITTWRAAVGVGLRFEIELFGPVPIELDLAAPISKDGEDDTRAFSFFIGGSF
ncbi:MAG: outer membrane protein assembly factor BamA [Phycisphaerales bacterium]|nr:outer membrane protein assembly factor BamA [Phycisphaerales bacterium]